MVLDGMRKMFERTAQVVAISAALLSADPVKACGGIPEPVSIPFAGQDIKLDAKNMKKGADLGDGFVVSDVKDVATRGRESGAIMVTLTKDGASKNFRIGFPPLTRSVGGCNQPYLSE